MVDGEKSVMVSRYGTAVVLLICLVIVIVVFLYLSPATVVLEPVCPHPTLDCGDL